ncbi:LysR family transcriptional regulator [Sphingomonas colocasiae]|uniref:LysR family transcriptional regulator n=1 Tax=Sphingomonas colocasiae TaxID=1848973 RepID=A0ABS7PMV8_9SPHN|nr:LysR family transcriptional regulator [Sphingomonas colocasiae]MBY8822598.1 LysR family transcriptional regulator [Sphingomonas colocasiae]
MLDWNDLRYFLAVARTGSTLAAGKSLGVSQTTAARRVAALEAAAGVTLFERRQAGYVLTAVGEALRERAEAVEAAAHRFAEDAGSHGREASGTVRLTMQEIHAVTIMAPILRDLREAHPTIRIELDTSEQVRDLEAGEADIALRCAGRPSGSGLVGRRVADEPWTVYCSRDYAARHGTPRRARDMIDHVIIGGGGKGVWRIYRAWLEQHGLADSVAIHHDSATGLLSAVRSGMGLATLPCFVADTDPELIRCVPIPKEVERGVWLLTHERSRHIPRVRVVLDFLGERLTQLARRQAQAGTGMAPGSIMPASAVQDQSGSS